jgi:hypothetical protein
VRSDPEQLSASLYDDYTELVGHSAYNDCPLLGAAGTPTPPTVETVAEDFGGTWNTYGTGSCAGKRLPCHPRQRMPNFHYWLIFGDDEALGAAGFRSPGDACLIVRAGHSRDTTARVSVWDCGGAP